MAPVLDDYQLREVERYAAEKHRASDFNHSMDHIETTVSLSRWLAAREHADEEVCVVSAYLHDIAKSDSAIKGDFATLQKESDGHGAAGAEQASAFLRTLGAPDPFVEQVRYAISQHDNDLPKETKEAAVLWDADKLQLVGPLGFARIFGYSMLYVKDDITDAIEQTRYWQEFFLSRFCTETGRRAAQCLHRQMHGFTYLWQAASGGQIIGLGDLTTSSGSQPCAVLRGDA